MASGTNPWKNKQREQEQKVETLTLELRSKGKSERRGEMGYGHIKKLTKNKNRKHIELSGIVIVAIMTKQYMLVSGNSRSLFLAVEDQGPSGSGNGASSVSSQVNRGGQLPGHSFMKVPIQFPKAPILRPNHLQKSLPPCTTWGLRWGWGHRHSDHSSREVLHHRGSDGEGFRGVTMETCPMQQKGPKE